MTSSRLSIRVRITGGSVLIAILISIVVGIVIFSQLQRIIHDGQVRLLESVEGPYLAAIAASDTEEFDPPGPGQFVAVIDPVGAVTLDTLPEALSVRLDGMAASDGVRTVQTGSVDYIVKSTSVEDGGGTWHLVTASAGDAEVLADVAWLLIASLVGINLTFGAASWLIGSAALAPVARLRRSAADLVTSPGDELLPVGPAHDDIADLAQTLNELIGELRASAERERQIVSDASHEFRTPLAIMQTRLELAQREATTLDQMRADVTATQLTLARLSALATSLLELSRIDAQSEPGHASVAQLSAELADAADRGRLRSSRSDIRIDYVDETTDPDAVVAVSDADFGRVCDNLVANALTALDRTGNVVLRLAGDAHAVRLSVEDDGGGMDPKFVPHAFDRFARESGSRTRAGAGLGLSIVAGIVGVAGGTVELDNRPGEGLLVEATFPILET